MAEKDKGERKGISPAIIIIPAALGLAAVGAIALATLGKAAPPVTLGLANLYGRVTDANTSAPLAGVQVKLEEAEPIFTDSNGYFEVLNLASEYFPCGLWVYFKKDGYEDKAANITVYEGNNELNVQMTPVTGIAMAQ